MLPLLRCPAHDSGRAKWYVPGGQVRPREHAQEMALPMPNRDAENKPLTWTLCRPFYLSLRFSLRQQKMLSPRVPGLRRQWCNSFCRT